MKSYLFGFLSAIVIALVAAAFVVYSGRAPISAADAETPLLDWLFHTSFERALERHAADITVPAQGASRPQLFRGARSFAAMCSGCHIPPGMEPTPYSQGLKPAPPDLVDIMRERTPAEAFWVLDNGVHFTGMPAIGVTHDDEELWALVEFLERAKTMEPRDYQRIIELAEAAEAAESHEGHQHRH